MSDVYFNNVNIDSAANPVSMESTENMEMSDLDIGELPKAPSFVK